MRTLLTIVALVTASSSWGQSVCLPSPRLLTTMPMGGQSGTRFDVTISGEHLDQVDSLFFSSDKIQATPKLDAAGVVVPNAFVVEIDADCTSGVYDARVMSRLGVSSARTFSVSDRPEMIQEKPASTVETATPLPLGTICNAVLNAKSINHFLIEAKQGQRLFIDCAARGIDSKTQPVVILADANGNDLRAERRGGVLEFDVAEDANYIVKVHDLTFSGNRFYFFRLLVREATAASGRSRMASTKEVNQFSWPPHGLADTTARETEPNDWGEQSQPITLPCDLHGSFYPEADVDSYQFTAKKGETWWVEVASERLGCPTDPSVVVQRVVSKDGQEELVDVAELMDIDSPVKRSSNGYSYDGPPYNAGSTDVLGKFDVPEDGTYRLQVTDLFGGARKDPSNVYRLIVRQAQPDFALIAWAMHMQLRNGDRNALSKPIALRGGATIPFDVVAIRRDGFMGEIQIEMSDLPEGVTATGLTIGAGKSHGTLLVAAAENAPRGMRFAKLIGRAVVEGNTVERPCHAAAMRWPVVNAKTEIPRPRLLDQLPVSVGGSEVAYVSIQPSEDRIWEATEGQDLKIPLVHTLRGEFSGKNLSLKTMGAGFERNPSFEVSLDKDSSEAVVQLGRLKTKPGDYVVAFYGGAVAKYASNPGGVAGAEIRALQAKKELKNIDLQIDRLSKTEAGVPPKLRERQTAAKAAVQDAEKRLAAAQKQSKPKDIADIYVTAPVKIRVHPTEKP